jgi:CHC2 zinc finger
MSTEASIPEILRFFETLYPDSGDGYLVLSWPSATRTHKDGSVALDSSWHNLSTTSLARIAQAAATRALEQSLYYGVALQHPSREPSPFQRSRNDSAYILPGLYFDIDLASGAHAASALPATEAEALAFLHALPSKPSLILHTGGGLHAYWLFESPHALTAAADRDAMTQVLKQFAHTLTQNGKTHGWDLDALRDLARVLRPPGTVNHKYDTPVRTLAARDVRYTLADFDWLAPLPGPSVPSNGSMGVQDQPDLVAVVEAYGGGLTQKSEQEWHGAHPIHGSATGVNLDVNLTKGLWHCWRHGTGGDALSFIALGAGLVACEDVRPGVLAGARFPQVLAIARERFGWTPPAAAQAPDPVDTWLGPRSTWYGVPRARREAHV